VQREVETQVAELKRRKVLRLAELIAGGLLQLAANTSANTEGAMAVDHT
jgi:hypothetical protein